MTTQQTTPTAAEPAAGSAASGSPDAGTAEWYRQDHERKGADRNDILRNPEVLFQVLAMERSVIEALRSMDLDPHSAAVLDVGCGSGGSLASLLRLGFRPSRLHGIDILEDRIAEA